MFGYMVEKTQGERHREWESERERGRVRERWGERAGERDNELFHPSRAVRSNIFV